MMTLLRIVFLLVGLVAASATAQQQPPVATNQQDEIVTIHLAPPSDPEEVLQILRTGDKFETNKYVTRVFELHHTQAIELLPSIRAVVETEKGVVRSVITAGSPDSPARSFLQVTTTKDQLPSVEEAIRNLDVPGLVNAAGTTRRAVRLQYRRASELGDILRSTRLTGQANVHADDLTNTLYFDDSDSVIRSADSYVEFYDVPIPQVEFDVQIIEIMESDGSRLGLDWDAWKRSIGGQVSLSSTLLEGGETFTRLDSLLVLDANVLANFLNYTVQTGTAHLVQRSRLNASNLEPALISDTRRVPHYDYLRSERTPVVSGETTADYPGQRTVAITPPSHNRLVEIPVGHEGLAIAIQPLIGTMTVTANIEIQVNSFIGFDQLDKPLLAEQKLLNRVTLSDGRKILLGTLERERRVEGRRGIPLLKEIPLLKYLFSVESTRLDRSRLFLIATPTFSHVGYDAPTLADVGPRPVLKFQDRELDLDWSENLSK